MHVRLHANATTTPRTRAYIQNSTATVAQLARELGVSETTVRRWKPPENEPRGYGHGALPKPDWRSWK